MSAETTEMRLRNINGLFCFCFHFRENKRETVTESHHNDYTEKVKHLSKRKFYSVGYSCGEPLRDIIVSEMIIYAIKCNQTVNHYVRH